MLQTDNKTALYARWDELKAMPAGTIVIIDNEQFLRLCDDEATHFTGVFARIKTGGLYHYSLLTDGVWKGDK